MSWPRRRRPDGSAESERPDVALVCLDEYDALLTGRYLEWWLAEVPHQVPPTWVWLNVLLQGSAAELEKVAAGLVPSTSVSRSWEQVRALLAADLILLSGHDPYRLRWLQRSALVPLDLSPGELLAPAQVLARVRTALLVEIRRQPPGTGSGTMPG